MSIDRRRFLQLGGAAAVTTPLAAQLLASSREAVDPAALDQHPDKKYLKPTACDMCGAQCPTFVRVVNDKVVATFANAASSYSGGKICGKAHAAVQKAYHPNRITQPMMRRGPGRYEPVSWTEAIDFIADRLMLIAKNHGENAVHVYMGLGSHADIWKSFWKKTWGTSNVFGNDSVCDAGRRTGCALTMGDSRPLPDLANTRVGVVFGTDYLSSTKYLWYATQLLGAMDSGAKFYVIDPRFSATAARAVAHGGTWVPIQPGTDAALAMAMANVIFAAPDKYAKHMNPDLVAWTKQRGWHDGPYGLGVARYAASLKDKTPEWAQTITGVSAKLIREMADTVTTSTQGLVDAWTGISHRYNGFYGIRAVMCLAGLANTIDRKGGLVRQHGFSRNKVQCTSIPGATYRQVGPKNQLVQACGMYRFVRSDVNAFVPKAMLAPDFAAQEYARRRGKPPASVVPYPVKGFITSTRNFANGNSDSPLWRKALNKLLAEKDSLVVDINLVISEQGAHSHLVLPEAAYCERDDFITPSSLYPTVHLRRAVVPAPGEAKTFYAITKLIAAALNKRGFKSAAPWADAVVPKQNYLEAVRESVSKDQGSEKVDWDQLAKNGAWQTANPAPRYGRKGFGWSKLGKFTRSFDFYVPSLAGKRPPNDKLHPAGKANAALAKFEMPPANTFEPLPVYRTGTFHEPSAKFPLRLVGCGRHQWSSASKTSHLPMCVEKEPENLLTINTIDANKLGLAQRAKVRVHSKAGGFTDIRVNVSESIKPGCVHMSNGYGQRNTLEPLARGRGANVNELTSADNVDPVAGAEGLAEMVVRVEPIK